MFHAKIFVSNPLPFQSGSIYRIVGIFRGYKCSQFSRIEPVPRKFIPMKIYKNSRRVQYYGFEANGVEVQLHVDVRMRQSWNSDHENKIREILCRGPSAKIYTLYNTVQRD